MTLDEFNARDGTSLVEDFTKTFLGWHQEGKLNFDYNHRIELVRHFRQLFGLEPSDTDVSALDVDWHQLEWVRSPHAWSLYQALLVKRGMK